MRGALGADDLRGAGHVPADPADHRDQLSHGVLGGDRVVQDRGIQRPPGLALQRPVCDTTAFTASKIRFGGSEAASRRRQDVNVVG